MEAELAGVGHQVLGSLVAVADEPEGGHINNGRRLDFFGGVAVDDGVLDDQGLAGVEVLGATGVKVDPQPES